jgi:hypothetical protein
MNRYGNLPPGCTDRDVDEASPGYWEEPMDHHNEPPGMDDAQELWVISERMIGQDKKAELMEAIAVIIRDFKLDSFCGLMK